MKKFILIFALIGFVLTISCTPEALTPNEQQIDKDKVEIPVNG